MVRWPGWLDGQKSSKFCSERWKLKNKLKEYWEQWEFGLGERWEDDIINKEGLWRPNGERKRSYQRIEKKELVETQFTKIVQRTVVSGTVEGVLEKRTKVFRNKERRK